MMFAALAVCGDQVAFLRAGKRRRADGVYAHSALSPAKLLARAARRARAPDSMGAREAKLEQPARSSPLNRDLQIE